MRQDIFFELPKSGIKAYASFSLVPFIYEKEMAERNGGLDLRVSMLSLSQENEEHYTSVVPNFWMNGSYNQKAVDELVEKYEGWPGISCLDVKSMSELEGIAQQIYQICYANYVLGKKHLLRSFPQGRCGSSSRSVMLSLMNLGYASTACAYNATNDHMYIIEPFVLGKSKGVIIGDPTSDQLWDSKKPRNMVSVVFSTLWEYLSDWKRARNGTQEDLYPA